MTAILALDQAGTPRRWISAEDAIVYVAKDLVAWSLGEIVAAFRGGNRRVDGVRSELSTSAIIAVKNNTFMPLKMRRVLLTNKTLFARDMHICAYCGKHFKSSSDLSRDHIHPVSRGGLNTWTNVVAACKRCNTHKSNRTPEEAGLQLLYVPYEPGFAENLILQNRKILASQMDFLLPSVPKHSRIHSIVN